MLRIAVRIALLLVFAVFCGSFYAQTADFLEARGSVLELGADGAASLPIEGVEVNVVEFVTVGAKMERSPVGTVYTDSRGTYRFHPEHEGDYWVEVKKGGYIVSPAYGVPVKLDRTHSTAQSTFTLIRRGSTVTGRVSDEDDRPVADLHVEVLGAGHILPGVTFGGDATALTAADGTFTASDVLAGPHIVRISSRAGELIKVEPRFLPDDLKTVDQDFETSYWPGGTVRPGPSVPVSPGGITSVGTIKIRKVPFYRVHVSVAHDECKAGEKWTFRVAYFGEVSLAALRPNAIPCAHDFLVRNLRPGAYSFMLETDTRALAKWAFASVDISSKNIDVALTMEPESQIIGQFVAASSATLPSMDDLKISVLGDAHEPSAASPDLEGRFVITGLRFPNHKVAIAGINKGYYIKEFRLNGASSPDDMVILSPGANQLEIVVDDRPAAISGTVTDSDKPAAEAEVVLYPKVLPLTGSPKQVPGGTVRADKDGRFQLNGLTPGEYRIVAWQPRRGSPSTGYGSTVTQLVARAQPITIERGRTFNIDLKLTDPSK